MIEIYYLSVVLPAAREAAARCGYAVGVHGSLKRDLDLIAVQWTADARPAAEVVEAVQRAVGGHIGKRPDGGDWPAVRPHGRLGWVIRIGGGALVDLSVMPLGAGP